MFLLRCVIGQCLKDVYYDNLDIIDSLDFDATGSLKNLSFSFFSGSVSVLTLFLNSRNSLNCMNFAAHQCSSSRSVASF